MYDVSQDVASIFLFDVVLAAVAADPVGWGERAGEVLVQVGDAVAGESAQAGKARVRRVARRVVGRLGVRLAIGGGVVVRGEHLGKVVAKILSAGGAVAAQARALTHRRAPS